MHKRVKVCVRVRPSAKENAGSVLVNQQEQVRVKLSSLR